jgi:hypothetical protein
VLLADATGCGATFGGCDSGCPRDEAGLNWADEAGVCSDGEDEVGLADCCAFALSVRSKKVEITQCQIRITQPSFRFCLRPVQHFEKRRSVAVVLVVVVTRRLLAWARAGQQPVGVLYLLRGMLQAWYQWRAASKVFFNCIIS